MTPDCKPLAVDDVVLVAPPLGEKYTVWLRLADIDGVAARERHLQEAPAKVVWDDVIVDATDARNDKDDDTETVPAGEPL